MKSFIFGGDTKETPDSLKRKRAIAEALMANSISRTPQNVGEGIASIGQALAGRIAANKVSAQENAGKAAADTHWNDYFKTGGGATVSGTSAVNASDYSAAPGDSATSKASLTPNSYAPTGDAMRDGIASTAAALGIDPVDLATTISYETGGSFSPTQKGPRTQWGQHRGLIQFGEPQAQEFGVNWDDPLNSQLGPDGAVAKYLRKAGVKPGMGLLDVYSAINAGGVGLYDRTDANNGGAPGTVRDKVEQQMADHRAKALAMFGSAQPANAAQAIEQQMQPAAYVDPMVSAQSGRTAIAEALMKQPQASNLDIPAEFQGSSQLRNAMANPRGSIVQALMEGAPADGGQIAQARAAGAQQMAQPQQAAQNPLGVDPKLLDLLSDPYLDEGRKAVVQALIDRGMKTQDEQIKLRQQQADPAYQIEREKAQIELDRLKTPPTKWEKLDGTIVYNPATGETKDLSAGPGGEKPFRFGGTSVEAQSLNGLIESGQLTPDQAQQLGAGKTITGPNGEIMFMTPQGVFGGKQGQQPQPLGGAPADGIDIFGDRPPVTETSAGQGTGLIPLTEPKVTIDEKKAMTFADRMAASGAIIDSMGMEGAGKFDTLAGQIPYVGDYLTSDAYKKVDAAKRDFINAQLRRESGAAIGQSEFDSAELQYFPQPNDSPELVEQKRLLRQRVIEGMKRDSGPTYGDKPDGGDWNEVDGVKIRKKAN